MSKNNNPLSNLSDDLFQELIKSCKSKGSSIPEQSLTSFDNFNHWMTSNNTNQFSIEMHGDGYSFYIGRTNYHHGLNIFNITDLDEKRFLKIKPLLENSNKMAETLISLENKINQLDSKEKVAFLDELDIIAELKNKLNKE